jgi:TonB family protein
MTPPRLIEGKWPAYSDEAKALGAHGKVIARCTLTEEGVLVDCRIIKSLPPLDQAVLDALATRRYTPTCYKGHPQRVYYTFPFNFDLGPPIAMPPPIAVPAPGSRCRASALPQWKDADPPYKKKLLDYCNAPAGSPDPGLPQP